jgi:hypothetical protein
LIEIGELVNDGRSGKDFKKKNLSIASKKRKVALQQSFPEIQQRVKTSSAVEVAQKNH